MPSTYRSHYSDVTWASWYIKYKVYHQQLDSLFNNLFEDHNKENIKASHKWPFVRESTGGWWFPSQRASNVEKISMSSCAIITEWCRHAEIVFLFENGFRGPYIMQMFFIFITNMSTNKLTVTWIKWVTLCRQHIKMHYLEWKYENFE